MREPPIRARGCRWAAAILLVLLSACDKASEQVLSEFSTPDGDYLLRLTLVVSHLESSPHVVHLYVMPRGVSAGEPAVTIPLENDGAPFSGDQIALTWASKRSVLMCLKPRGADRHGVRVELSDPLQIEEVPRC